MRLNNIAILLLLMFGVSSFLYGQSYSYKTYYYELSAVINSNGERAEKKGDGQFYTFTEQSCYESDKNGNTEEIGVAKFINYANHIYVYRGKGYYGDADYLVTDNYETLNIKTVGGTIYVLNRKKAPDSFIASEHKKIMTEIELLVLGGPTYPLPQQTASTNDININSNVHRSCSGCGGSGFCSMCHGKGWYKNIYDGKIYDCSSCGGSGRCRVCHGKGHCN